MGKAEKACEVFWEGEAGSRGEQAGELESGFQPKQRGCLQGWGSLLVLLTRCQADREWVKDVGGCSKVTRAWPSRLIEPPKVPACSGEWSSELELAVTQSHAKRTLEPCLTAGPGPWGPQTWGNSYSNPLESEPEDFGLIGPSEQVFTQATPAEGPPGLPCAAHSSLSTWDPTQFFTKSDSLYCPKQPPDHVLRHRRVYTVTAVCKF